jgi:hypothetical protein
MIPSTATKRYGRFAAVAALFHEILLDHIDMDVFRPGFEQGSIRFQPFLREEY